MGPYLSRTPIRVHPVFRQGSSGPVGSRRDISAKSAKVRSGPKTSSLVRNGSRIDRLARNKDQMNRIACPDPSGPLLRPKTANIFFFKENGPRRPRRTSAAPLTPIGAGRGLRKGKFGAMAMQMHGQATANTGQAKAEPGHGQAKPCSSQAMATLWPSHHQTMALCGAVAKAWQDKTLLVVTFFL